MKILSYVAASATVLLFFGFCCMNLTSSPWQKLASMPTTRTEMASAVVGGEIYLIGGYLHPNSLSTMQKYSPVSNRWSNCKDLPLALDHVSAVGFENYIYVIGGLYLAEEGTPSKKVFRYSVTENKWEEIAPLPEALGAVSAVLIDKTIHVFGGIGKSGSTVGSHYVYDIPSDVWSEEPQMPFSKDHIAVATDGIKIFFTGGWGAPDRFSNSFLALLFIYDSKTKSWQEGPSLPTPRGDVFGAMVGKYFVVAGGENDKSEVLDVVEALDTENMQWKTLPSLRAPRHGGSAVSLDGNFYLIGGRNSDHSWGYTDLNERLKII